MLSYDVGEIDEGGIMTHDEMMDLIDRSLFATIGYKDENGRQSQEQKNFERMYIAAGYAYVLCYGFEEFKKLIRAWVANCPREVLERIKEAHKKLEKDADERAYKQFKNIINPRNKS